MYITWELLYCCTAVLVSECNTTSSREDTTCTQNHVFLGEFSAPITFRRDRNSSNFFFRVNLKPFETGNRGNSGFMPGDAVEAVSLLVSLLSCCSFVESCSDICIQCSSLLIILKEHIYNFFKLKDG